MSDITKTPPTLDELYTLREEILHVAAQYGASNVRVFGSVARGEATAESDIDLLVDIPVSISMFELVGLWLDLKDLLGHEVSLVTDEEHPHQERFMSRIRKDAIPL